MQTPGFCLGFFAPNLIQFYPINISWVLTVYKHYASHYKNKKLSDNSLVIRSLQSIKITINKTLVITQTIQGALSNLNMEEIMGGDKNRLLEEWA